MNGDTGLWSRYATTRRDLVRRSFDLFRWVEQRVDSGTEVPRGGFGFGTTISSVDTEDPVVAITFDDGPEPELTPRLLEILDERGVKATFYLVGENARRHPEVVAQIDAGGHELGNHTWSHRFLTTQTARSIRRELRTTDDAISEVLGRSPATLRPPYGAVTRSLAGWAQDEFGYRTILWSVDAADWESPSPDVVVDRIVSGTGPGSIILAHDPLPHTVAAMPETLDRLLAAGYRFVTISDLIHTA